VVKKADRLDRMHSNPSKIDKNCFVFEGTTIVQVSDKKRMSKYERFREEFGIPVCVIRTNFTTTKGQLIRIILFPREQDNIFQREAMKFLFFLFIFAIVSYVVLVIVNLEYETTEDIIIKFIDIILIAVPPALPVSMTFGVIYAI
jgi:cation-transporting P-type ATPase 13A2